MPNDDDDDVCDIYLMMADLETQNMLQCSIKDYFLYTRWAKICIQYIV
jgi:hypothetical protein